jgi:hypothetical protein
MDRRRSSRGRAGPRVDTGRMSWLDPVRAALDRLSSPREVFVRDDDAGWGDERLSALLDVCADAGCPVDVAVIPTELTPALAARLHRHARNATVRLHQHGYAHVNHEPTGRKCEFGPSRPPRQVVADVRSGAALLRDHLGEVDPVFTPPWNRSTSDLADVLVAAGITVLSRDHTAPTIGHPQLQEVPVTVDWFGRDKGVRWSPDRFAGRLAESLTQDRVVGVMLHHAVTDDAELARVGELLGLLTGHDATTMTTLAALGTTARRTDAVRG